MNPKTGKIHFTPKALLKNPLGLVILLLLFLFFSNVFTMWGEAFSGNIPYGSQENFQTYNGEFKHTLILSKFTTAEEEIEELTNNFETFKKDNPEFENLKLYRTSNYYNIKWWMFWKWYRYFETGHIRQYPYLDTK